MRLLASLALALLLLLPSLPALAASPEGVLLVAFGTSVDSALPSLQAVERAYKQAYPGRPVVWAYTSDIIRKKLAREQGLRVLSVKEALDECSRQGVVDLRVQSLHVTGGEEFSMLERMLVRSLTLNPGRFEHVWLGHPLLESSRDLEEVRAALFGHLAKRRQPGEAVVLMGHGNDRGPGDLTLAYAAHYFNAGDGLVYLASVEGANAFDKVLPQLREKGVTKVLLQPFMLVAGDHANNDLAGGEDESWASRLKAQGFETEAELTGLGLVEGVPQVYLRHTRETGDDLAHPKKSD